MGVTIYLMRSETITNPFLSIPTLFALTLALISAACSNEPPPTPTPSPTARVTLASTDLAVGQNRVVFALIQPGGGAIKDAQVTSPDLLSSPARRRNQAVQTAPADIPGAWPGGTAGVYRANLAFDRAGDWGLGIIATLSDGLHPERRRENPGKNKQAPPPPSAPPAPRSHTKTASDAPDNLTHITTDPKPRPRPLPTSHSRRPGTNPGTPARNLRHPRLLSHRHLRPTDEHRQAAQRQLRRPDELHPRRGLRQPRPDP